QDARYWQRDLMEKLGDVRKRQRREIERRGIQRDDVRRRVALDDAEVLAIRGIARQRHDARAAIRQAGVAQVTVDTFASLQTLGCALLSHDAVDVRIASRCEAPAGMWTPSVTMQSSTTASGPISTPSHRIEPTTRAVGSTCGARRPS